MIVLFAALFGILLGVFNARKAGGRKLDMAQWGAAYGILFALIGVFATIFIHRYLAG